MLLSHLRFFGTKFVMILVLLAVVLGMTPVRPAHADTIMVTNTNASGPGSLPEAITSAIQSGETIKFDPSLAGATIALGSQLTLFFASDLTIDGSGLNPPVVLSGGNESRIMRINGTGTIIMSDLAFTKGVSTDGGGAIEIGGLTQLTLENCTFYQNQASLNGGAISVTGSADITVSNSTFYQNQAGASGGAISLGGNVSSTIVNSTFLNNSAAGDGGAISSFTATISDSAFSGNIAGGSGGAIEGAILTIKNTTINHNQADSAGGALVIEGNSSSVISNSTVFENRSGFGGGAIFAQGTVNIDIFNSTFAGNNAPAGSEIRISGIVYVSLFNTILACAPENNGCIYQTASGFVGGPHSIIDTGTVASFGLAQLADNGGSTKTMALLPNSPLIDAGDDSVCANSTVNNLDQRGVARPQGSHCDIGAFESIPPLIVTKTTDTNDGVCDTDCSLREAIFETTEQDRIKFDPSLAGDTILLTSELLINKNVTIDGSGLNPQVVLSGQNTSQIMETTSTAQVTISDLTFTGGMAIEGGAIYVGSNSRLTIENSTFHQNQATSSGGAIFIAGNAVLTLLNSTLYQNEGWGAGGAISMDGNAQTDIVNSTITQNYAAVGGAIFTTGNSVMTVTNGTVAHNGIGSSSELLVMFQSEVVLSNTQVVCVPRVGSCVRDRASSGVTLKNSFAEKGTLVAFGLAELADNGGPTQTMALLPESPLIDAGDDTICAASPVSSLDQRGATRLQGSHCDIGAYEDQFLVRFVKQDAIGTGDGSSWTNAHTDLQSALAVASPDEEIWVAAGTYKPTTTTDRAISFNLKNGVSVFGGFTGTETARAQRDYETNITVLSGDIGVENDNSDNSYHVVVGSNTNTSALLDGFTVMSGKANDTLDFSPESRGGGMYNYLGSPAVKNTIFINNSAALGGGMYNGGNAGPPVIKSYPILTNVIFENNFAIEGGGVFSENYVHSTFTNVTFDGNTASRVGGGMEDRLGTLSLTNVVFENNTAGSLEGGAAGGLQIFSLQASLTNVTFSNNSAVTYGGGLVNADGSESHNPELTNVTFYGNSAEFGGGMWNHQSDPILTNVTLSGNSASIAGGGIYNETFSDATVRNTILWGNTAPTGAQIYSDNNSSSAVRDSVVQGGFAKGTNIITADPLLNPLQDNGGFTETMALSSGSSAIDTANDIYCPDIDQRGMARPQGSHCDIGAYEYEVFSTNVTVGNLDAISYPSTEHEIQRKSYTDVNSGPVKITNTGNLSLLASERVIYKINKNPTSFSEMMGLPENQLDKTYWLPWYNNVDLDTQLRIANVTDQQATITVTIGGVPQPSFDLAAGESTRVSYPGVNNGPVKIESTQNIVAAERVIYKVNGIQTSFSEMMALPANQLDNTCWLPWYNNVDLDTQLRIANVSGSSATVTVTIGGVPQPSFDLAAGASTRVSYAGVNSGPVKIESDQDIVAAARVIYKVKGIQTSFSEMIALPEKQVDKIYWLPWYNNVDLDTQLRIANVSGSQATVTVTIGGVPQSPFNLAAGESTRISFDSIDKGPVKIESTQNMVVAERVIYKVKGIQTSFSEMMGMPGSLLDSIFWFPWYNNVELDTQLRFGTP